MRLSRGGSREDSARMSLSSGGSPSTLAVPPRGKERRLAAKARAAVKESGADHRAVKAEMLGPRAEAGAALERAEAREKSDKGGSFSAPAATELESEDDKLASRRLSELWVGALLGSARECECSAGSVTCGPAGGSSRSERGDQCSVNCKLRPPPPRAQAR